MRPLALTLLSTLLLPGCLSEFERTYDHIVDICVSDGGSSGDDTYVFSIAIGGTTDRTVEVLEESCTVELEEEGQLRVVGFTTRLMKESRNDGPIGDFQLDCGSLANVPPGDYIFRGAPPGPITLPLEPGEYWCARGEF